MLEFPYCGENRQILYQKGVKVQRTRIRDSIHRVDHDGVNARKDSRLHGCFYSLIKGANYLWHAYIYNIHNVCNFAAIVAQLSFRCGLTTDLYTTSSVTTSIATHEYTRCVSAASLLRFCLVTQSFLGRERLRDGTKDCLRNPYYSKFDSLPEWPCGIRPYTRKE